jgi:hypothetical protein
MECRTQRRHTVAANGIPRTAACSSVEVQDAKTQWIKNLSTLRDCAERRAQLPCNAHNVLRVRTLLHGVRIAVGGVRNMPVWIDFNQRAAWRVGRSVSIFMDLPWLESNVPKPLSPESLRESRTLSRTYDRRYMLQPRCSVADSREPATARTATARIVRCCWNALAAWATCCAMVKVGCSKDIRLCWLPPFAHHQKQKSRRGRMPEDLPPRRLALLTNHSA